MIEKKKVCSFFVSEYHLLTILLPYIKEKTAENKKVELMTENDMLEKTKQYLRKVSEFEYHKYLKLGWKKNRVEEAMEKDSEVDIGIGNEEYIGKVNMMIEQNKNTKIYYKGEMIDCYNIESLGNLSEIVAKHDFVLKTTGKSEITKCSHNEQKRKTIKTQI